MHTIFKDDLEGFGGSALPKTHLDDVLIVRLALHQGRNIKDKARHLNGDDLDGNGHSPACQYGSVDDLCILQGGRGGRSSAECVSPETCLLPTAATPQTSTSSGEVAHERKGLPLPSPRLSSDDQPRRTAAEAVPAFWEHPFHPLSQSSQSDISTPSWLVTVLWVSHQPSIPLCWLPPLPL